MAAKFDVERVRKDFPILQRKINGKQVIYLDSAATAQKPQAVIDTISNFYKNNNANVHRGLHTLSEESTNLYEGARKKIAKFINADYKETIFTRNASEGINLVAKSFVAPRVKKGDTILITEMEHHSNIVPWQMLVEEKGVKVEYIPFTDEGVLDMKKAKELIAKKPVFFSLVHISNVLGTVNPVRELVELAHRYNVPVLIDGAQSVPHRRVDVKELDCDFLVFSSHKMCGPSGIGVLYGKKEILEKMKPFLGGGDMIKEVSYKEFSTNDLPWKFEAGTPNIEGAVGLGAAVDYLESIGMENIENHVKEITRYALEKLSKVKNVKIIGPKDRAGVIAFNLGDMHSHDVTTILDEDGIATRAGHHCAQPLVEKLGLASAARASFYLYTKKEDIDELVRSLERARKVFKL